MKFRYVPLWALVMVLSSVSTIVSTSVIYNVSLHDAGGHFLDFAWRDIGSATAPISLILSG